MRHNWGSFNSSALMILLILSSALVACGGSEPDNSASANNGMSSGQVQDGDYQTPDNPQTQECETTALRPTPLRRLTRFEYKNSVRDLLGVDTAIVDEIPADESDGFDNNAALQVAPEFLIEKYVLVSESLAAAAVQNLRRTTNCDAALRGEQNCAREFAEGFGRRAFRRPLSTDDIAAFMQAYALGVDGGTYAQGIAMMIRFALQSPHFLYRLELSAQEVNAKNLLPLSAFELATRLSFFLWGTGPDDALLDVAANGGLNSKEQIATKAREMLASPKARVSLNNFLAQWSGVHKLEIMTKNTSLFPNFSSDVREAMQRELPAFVDYLFDTNDVSLNHLFTANVAFVSGPLASIYGVEVPRGSATDVVQITPPPSQGRSGLLTQAGFLAVQGHPDQTSPVLRGKFVQSNLLCNPVPPPPDDLDISVPEITSGPTARSRAALHRDAGSSCNVCHRLMDPIGLAFEFFDAIGQHRETENGVNIDVSGEILGTTEPVLQGEFQGVRALANKLVNSEAVKNCVANHMFRFAAGRFEEGGDNCSIGSMQERFVSNEGDLIELMVAMTQTDVFLYRSQGGL